MQGVVHSHIKCRYSQISVAKHLNRRIFSSIRNLTSLICELVPVRKLVSFSPCNNNVLAVFHCQSLHYRELLLTIGNLASAQPLPTFQSAHLVENNCNYYKRNRLQSSKPIFQTTHLYEGDYNEARKDELLCHLCLSTHPSLGRRQQHRSEEGKKDRIDLYFQPTHLWEGDSNSQSQNPCRESFSNQVLAKLLKTCQMDSSERLPC